MIQARDNSSVLEIWDSRCLRVVGDCAHLHDRGLMSVSIIDLTNSQQIINQANFKPVECSILFL